MTLIQKYRLYKKMMKFHPTTLAETGNVFTWRRIEWNYVDDNKLYTVQSNKYYDDCVGNFYFTHVYINGKTVMKFFDGYMARKLFEHVAACATKQR